MKILTLKKKLSKRTELNNDDKTIPIYTKKNMLTKVNFLENRNYGFCFTKKMHIEFSLQNDEKLW